MRDPIATLRAHFAQPDSAAFADLLPADRVEAALREEGATWRHRVYTPAVTLWAFLAQVADPDRSCRAAVARVLAGLAARGRPAARPATGAYCKARARLPEGLPRRLAREAGRDLHRAAAAGGWLWRGRRVKVADGTTVSMPDTRANQRAYPQPNNQKPGLGFPVARVVAVFCLATGAVVDAALGRGPGKQTGEAALLRELAGGFDPGDVVLADRLYGSFYDLATWLARGVDVVVRLHQARRPDFRTGRRLGPKDHVVTWGRPDRPRWVDDATLAGMPRTLTIREVAVRVPRRGFRTRGFVVATTLVDAARYPAAAVADLYRARWHAELDLRSLKCTLGVDVLRCRTPAMVRKEFWMHVLAYNLIRGVAARAAHAAGAEPREVSFAGTLQAVRAFAGRLAGADAAEVEALHERLLQVVGAQRVGDRPDRVEPRGRKRRPKHGALLTKSRQQARAELLKGVRT
jgi:hypothetical protein